VGIGAAEATDGVSADQNGLERTSEAPAWRSERDLVAALRAGEEPAFEHLVRQHGGRLLAVATRLTRNTDDARDCVQEAFLSAFRAVDRFEERASLGTWLHRLVTNAALMKLRAKASRPSEPLDDAAQGFDEAGIRSGVAVATDETAHQILEREGTRRLVHAAIDRLPDTLRTVLLLRDIEGYLTDEVASMLEISAGATKTRLHRARAALREQLMPVLEGRAPS
jgi:RNA polymerase sigma-70 factor (ECF subfamily)